MRGGGSGGHTGDGAVTVAVVVPSSLVVVVVAAAAAVVVVVVVVMVVVVVVATAAAPLVLVEAEGASGSDVDGRLSLSSANNIQHRPLHPSHHIRTNLPQDERERERDPRWKSRVCIHTCGCTRR